MLIKEYRIPLPMSVEEYRIAQLYMIQKKSRQESSGAGSGVEILQNEPYEDGPGGKGQYTYKIYHIGSHLPGWFRAILPKSALRVEEEAWNAYPYTKTIYRCPFIDKFVLEIETVYHNDDGCQENVFNLSGSDLRNRDIDYLDIVRDTISSGDYTKEEDPKLYVSEKTGRGPLRDNWRAEYSSAIAVGSKSTEYGSMGPQLMTAYKLCRVEFKYWGMQGKIERFIHDIGLRKTMLRAHRQAWAWQDEYHGMTLDDIRQLEKEAQKELEKKYAALGNEEGLNNDAISKVNGELNLPITEDNMSDDIMQTPTSELPALYKKPAPRKSLLDTGNLKEMSFGSIEKLQTPSDEEEDDDEFFDAEDWMDTVDFKEKASLFRTSSMELITAEEDFTETPSPTSKEFSNSPLDRRVEQYRQMTGNSLDLASSANVSPNLSFTASQGTCRTTILFLVIHGGSLLDAGSSEYASKHTDVSTLKATLDGVLSSHYPSMVGHIASRLVKCPHICSEVLQLLTSLSPFGYDAQTSSGKEGGMVNLRLPVGAISLFAAANPEYSEAVVHVIHRANVVYNEFLHSSEGHGFMGQVCIIADSVGSILAYDALCKDNPYLSQKGSRYGSQNSLHEGSEGEHERQKNKMKVETLKQAAENGSCIVEDRIHHPPHQKIHINEPDDSALDSHPDSSHPKRKISGSQSPRQRNASYPSSRRTSSTSQSEHASFEFAVSDVFMLGSPLALVLAYRKFNNFEDKNYGIPRPVCNQIYNIFYPTDPTAARLEPLIYQRFQAVPPMKTPRYQHFPMGDGQSTHVVETIQSHAELLGDNSPVPSSAHSTESPANFERRFSNMSSFSSDESTYSSMASITRAWWGSKRLDYALYCPEALQSFPLTVLPNLLHASFWESNDLMAFILRQIIRQDNATSSNYPRGVSGTFRPSAPREKWLKRRTTIKLRNMSPNHRANDVIVLEGKPQQVVAKFMYGPLDMVSLSGERFDVHIMTNPSSGEWQYFGTDLTDSAGKGTYEIEKEKQLPQGMYPVKMIVRGDHTSVDFLMTVLPPKTECVVFSIDGSFTASVSIMGKDPKVRAGAVDVVRHWQELGYLILYITARPDMQQRKVVTWLAQHNFPHGMVGFMDGISAEPLKQKANYLRSLVQEADIVLHSGYGSAKDITVYTALNMAPNQIFIVGKVAKKQHKDANVISEGYATHLSELVSHTLSRPATGNARLFLRKICFSLPGQTQSSKATKKSVRKTVSLPHNQNSARGDKHDITVTNTGNTVLEPGGLSSSSSVSRARGTSPRIKISPFRFENSDPF